MALNSRRDMLGLIAAGMMSAMVGCASSDPRARVYHGLQIEVSDKIYQVDNIRYTYGDEFVNVSQPSARSFGPMFVYFAPMRIPDKFDITWETLDGKTHEAKVPVRSRLPGSIENKKLIFVIMCDHIEGYVAITTHSGEKRERFY